MMNDTERDSEGINQALQILDEIVEKLLPVRVKGPEIQNEMYAVMIELAR